MVTKSVKVGLRLRRFREEHNLTQAALARALGLSASYVNQMESNQRPITAPVLLRLVKVFDADIQQFSTDEADRLSAQLHDIFAESSLSGQVTMTEIQELANGMPAIARYLIELHRRHQHEAELHRAITARFEPEHASSSIPAPMAYEEVRDFFYAQRNYFSDLDETAEQVFADADLTEGDTAPGIAQHLKSRHGTRIVDLADDPSAGKRRFDPTTNTLALSPLLTPGQRAFQLATHLAIIEFDPLIDQIISDAALSSDETRSLARIGLANYFAGALIMPYRAFLTAAEKARYDIALLQHRFRVSYETVAHRLSTLQRPNNRGVPLIFVRIDRAGNISKRQSATDFHFSRIGGSCPLWNIYEAFAHPGQIQTQLAQMPDERTYLWVARTVSRHTGGYGTPAKTFSIGLGCDLHHAHRLVYSDGLDLANPTAPTPIGPGCKICDRDTCPQRAFPAISKPLKIDPHQSRFNPYTRTE